jgi:uncharacterized protein (DUF362 family)
LTAKVAVVKTNDDAQAAMKKALKLIGKIDDLNTKDRQVVIKVGVFDPESGGHTTVEVADAIAKSFNKAPHIFFVESDNYRGTGTERLEIWKEVFAKKVTPINLSEEQETRKVRVADEEIALPNILFKPNVFISTHVVRKFERGSILKNLLGLIPDQKKARFHKKMVPTLLDLYEAVGGIDLAVLDGTYTSQGVAPSSKKTRTDIIIVGRDAVAVEAIGFMRVGIKPENMPIIREAVERGLGEGDLKSIEILGDAV